MPPLGGNVFGPVLRAAVSTFRHPGGLVATPRAGRDVLECRGRRAQCWKQQGATGHGDIRLARRRRPDHCGVGQLLVAPAPERFDQMMASAQSLVVRRQGPYIPSPTQARRIRMFACEAVDHDLPRHGPDSSLVPLLTWADHQVRSSRRLHMTRPTGASSSPASTDLAVGRHRRPHGVGSRYTKRLIGITIEESVLVWDEGARLAFRVIGTTAPAFHACVEDYHFESDGNDGTLLRVAVSGKGRHRHQTWPHPVLPRAFALLMTRMGQNIERGRWFSTPTYLRPSQSDGEEPVVG